MKEDPRGACLGKRPEAEPHGAWTLFQFCPGRQPSWSHGSAGVS